MSIPKPVKIALALAAIALASGFINTFSLWQSSVNQFGPFKAALIVAIPTLVYVALLLLVGRRYNWARIVLIVLLIISVPGYVMSLFGPHPIMNKAVQAFQLVLNSVCVLFLFTPTARGWFKNREGA